MPLFKNPGILGLNARNLLYIKPFNPRKAVAFADDKLKTKAFLGSRGIPVARIFGRIETRNQLREFDFRQLPDTCVLKPNAGFGGEGIMILKGRRDGMFLENGKRPVPMRELVEHIEDILDGKFSVNGRPDTAFFEQILTPHECFARFRPVGLPDIRIIVFNLVPVMAMLRIPTAESQGKANLHLGGIGIGIDIAKGITTHAAQYHHTIRELPHGGNPAGTQIPSWDDILLISSRIQQITNIGYLAVDITIDADMGPVLLEVNARAGLTVQIANLAPLRSRLERVEGLTVSSPEKGVRIGKDLFGTTAKTQREPPMDAERPVLGTVETIAIACPGSTITVPARIAPDRQRSAFSVQLVKELREKGAVEEPENGVRKRTVRVKFTLGGRKIQTLVDVADLGGMPERAVIGLRDVSGFLIDPLKKPERRTPETTVQADLRAVDRMLADADRALAIIRHLKPLNLSEERARAARDPLYEPIFTYAELDADLQAMQERLSAAVTNPSPLGQLLEQKRRELLRRMTLLHARGDAASFTAASIALYGGPTASLIRAADAAVHRASKTRALEAAEFLREHDVLEELQETLQRYGLHDWQVVLRERMVADCAVGGRTVAIRRGARFTKHHLRALIAHEIETHVLTSENGESQPWELLRRGCAGYLDTQEGLAILNQNRFLPEHHPKRAHPARSLLAVAFAMDHGFRETRRYLEEELGYDADKALTKAIDVKRGLRETAAPGAFTKGIVYFRGAGEVAAFAESGGDLRQLYVGKIALRDLERVREIPGLQPPVLLPEFLRNPVS